MTDCVRLIPEDSRVCPGSIFLAVKGSDRCYCGGPLAEHRWQERNGVLINVQAAAVDSGSPEEGG